MVAAQFLHLVTLVLMLIEIQTIIVHVLLDIMMPVSINVKHAIQVVLPALVQSHVQAVMLENSEFSTILFVFVKMDSLNLFSLMELKYVLHAQVNVKNAL